MDIPGRMKVVGIGGSMAAESHSLSALEIALAGAEQAGAEVALFDIRELALPMYVPGETHIPDNARRLCDAVYAAQGLIWSTPLYHGSISGSFKNALDWLELLSNRDPAYLTDKIVGLISTAGGSQGLQAINTMEFIVRALRAWAVPLVIPIPSVGKMFDEQGNLKNPGVERQLENLGGEVVRAAQKFAQEGMCDYDGVEENVYG